MSSKNLKKYSSILVEEFADEKSKTGAKNEKRKSLEKLIPQVFAQSEKELLKEIRSLKKEMSGTAQRKKYGKDKPTYFRGKMLEEVEKSGGKTEATEIRVPPPIDALSEKDVLNIFKTVFKGFKKAEKAKFQKGTIIGSNGDPIDMTDYNELNDIAKKVTKYEYITAVVDLTIVNKNLKKKFGEAVAAAEIQARKDSSSSRETNDLEQKYIAARITGYQPPKFKVGGKQTLYRQEGLTDAEKSSGIQLGHGEFGDPTFLHTARGAEKRIDELVSKGKITKKESEVLKIGIYESRKQWKHHIEHREDLSFRKQFKKNYTLVIITGQRTSGNMDDSTIEKTMSAPIRSWWRYLASEGEHRTVFKKSIGHLLVGKLTLNNKGVKSTSKRWKPTNRIRSNEKSPQQKYTFKQKRRLAIQGNGNNLTIAAKKVAKDNKKTKNPTRATKASSLGASVGSPMSVINMFNASLEEAIRDNMGEPRLVNRTGRFAESVKVLNIIPNRGTSGVIQYAYRRNPYEIFEGDGTRDPRLLIDKTIREQAAEMALGKFTTQRL